MNPGILKDFCSAGFRISKMDTPFYRNGHTYATDGFICIRINGKFAEENKEAPLADDLDEWDLLLKLTPDWRLRADKMKEVKSQFPVCQSCHPLAVTTKCPECNGEGWVTLSNDPHEYGFECKTCCGDGHTGKCNTRDCPHCNGSRTTYASQWEISGQAFNTQLLIKLTEKLGDIELFCWPVWSSEKRYPALAFRFDGGEGLLMPMKPNPEERRINTSPC